MSLLSTIGCIALAFALLRTLQFLYSTLSPGNLPRYRHHGSYAFVTGSTNGIGKALAFALAERGFNIILHGRNPTKLDATKKELQARFPQTKLETVLADACTADPAEIADRIAHLPVSVLINNAGVGTFDGAMLYLNAASQKQVDAMMSTNMRFPTLLTRAMIPRLAQPALVVNLTSVASITAPPSFAVYGSTKTFINALTAGVRREVAVQGMDITVQTLQVGSVTTTVSMATLGFLSPTPDVYARSVLDRIGGRQNLVMGYPWHWVLYAPANILPARAMEFLLHTIIENRKKAGGRTNSNKTR
ncbi:hypothetical protein BOTBODRAFT_406354 [Botryobasidium botryosum FD-172 SS1]|uniref:Uncharacterized protein n=1 Tax=Botryobasidium botryosum (strain FD-172 SS1) TaxID=930990 RepID=A0A067ME29_BOTB1|nr:hypothetical protein BOTBODRAFT_406354 [Botryobasidium botryosum FD-172 SS1]